MVFRNTGDPQEYRGPPGIPGRSCPTQGPCSMLGTGHRRAGRPPRAGPLAVDLVSDSPASSPSPAVGQQCQLPARGPRGQPGQGDGVPEGRRGHQHLQPGRRSGERARDMLWTEFPVGAPGPCRPLPPSPPSQCLWPQTRVSRAEAAGIGGREWPSAVSLSAAGSGLWFSFHQRRPVPRPGGFSPRCRPGTPGHAAAGGTGK